MTKEQTVQGYLMNSPKVVAEMLYDTIEEYEKSICEKDMEIDALNMIVEAYKEKYDETNM